jgi:hypothetical protein
LLLILSERITKFRIDHEDNFLGKFNINKIKNYLLKLAIVAIYSITAHSSDAKMTILSVSVINIIILLLDHVQIKIN